MKDICVVGFGAIGILYACALSQDPQVRITAICRSNYEAVSQHGIDIVSDKIGVHSQWRPYRVVRTVQEAADRTYEYIICAFKCLPDVITTPALLAPLIQALSQDDATTFVLLQNGIGIHDDLQLALSTVPAKTAIISGCAWVDATAIDGGRKVTQVGTERLVLGVHTSPASPDPDSFGYHALQELCRLLERADVTAIPADDIDVARWRKVLWNTSFSTLCTLTRATVGEVLAVPASRTALADIMHEVLTVARASLSPVQAAAAAEALPDTVIIDIVNHENPESVFKPSMLVDLEAGRPIELEAIVGGVLRRAREAGVETPRLSLVYAALAVIQAGLRSKVQ